MKALAAVSIRHYEKAVESLAEYNRTIELGLQVVLKSRVEEMITPAELEKPQRFGAIIYGSDQGMCGQFNVQVASHAIETMDNNLLEQSVAILKMAGRRLGEQSPIGEFDSAAFSYRPVH